MTASIKHLLTHQHILLLQGKMGSFFNRFAVFLSEQGKQVSKVNFNAGDAFFYQQTPAYDYKKRLDEFNTWLTQLITDKHIDAVVCFGDCRPYHAIASDVCGAIDCSFFVFEEGYLRPDYITLQEHGINGYSRLDVSHINPDDIAVLPQAHDKPLFTDNRFYRLVFAAIVYYVICNWHHKQFPYYEHYRGYTAWQEAYAWLRAAWLKVTKYFSDKNLTQKMVSQYDECYFLVSLQVHNDSQIVFHSDYDDLNQFIEEIVASFAQHAQQSHILLFKHHPLDRGHRLYYDYIHALAQKYQVAGRVFFGCDMHLPTLIKHSKGMITVNSTTGLQSVYHRKPTKAMGRAIYNIAGLTDQQNLDMFWQNPQLPNHDYYLRFREYLIEQTQLNGSFYGQSPWMRDYTPPQ